MPTRKRSRNTLRVTLAREPLNKCPPRGLPSGRLLRPRMNNPAASRGVSKPKTTAKMSAPRGGELNPERLKHSRAGSSHKDFLRHCRKNASNGVAGLEDWFRWGREG